MMCVFCNEHKIGFVSPFLTQGTGEGNVIEAEALLEPYFKKFPNVSLAFSHNFMLGNWKASLMLLHTCIQYFFNFLLKLHIVHIGYIEHIDCFAIEYHRH